MKITGKNKKVHEIAEDLMSRNVEVTVNSLASAAMGHVMKRDHLADRYKNLVQRDFSNYMKEIYVNIPQTPSNV